MVELQLLAQVDQERRIPLTSTIIPTSKIIPSRSQTRTKLQRLLLPPTTDMTRIVPSPQSLESQIVTVVPVQPHSMMDHHHHHHDELQSRQIHPPERNHSQHRIHRLRSKQQLHQQSSSSSTLSFPLWILLSSYYGIYFLLMTATTTKLWYVHAFSVPSSLPLTIGMKHNNYHTIITNRRNGRMIHPNLNYDDNAKTSIYMSLQSHPFENDIPQNSNEELQQQQQVSTTSTSPIMIPVVNNESSTTGNTRSTLSGGTGSAVVAASTAAATTTSSSNNNNKDNNPPFLVTLDDASQHSYTEAIQRTIGWVSAAIIFGSTLWITNGATTGEEFFAGYLVEQSLSVDNLFVFLLLFEYFQVPIQYQDRVLNWGIYGAIVMRSVMIGLGSVALQQFHFILLVFAAILVYSSVSFFIKSNDDDEEKEDPSQNSIVQFSRSLFPSTDTFDENRFFTMVDGIRTATPLFICMIAVEISDVVFAIDSIPAVFGVTENPLIVFSSNIFAIMGLRSLYTILSKAATDLKYLEPAVALVLGFIGSKMIAEYMDYIIPTNVALLVVATLLSTGIGLSILEQQQHDRTKEE